MNYKSENLNISDECEVHYSSEEPVYGCWHWSGDEIVMWTEREEADARITGSADFNEHDISTNFTIEEGLAFDGSSVSASFVEKESGGTMVYKLSGTSCAMGEELAAAFYSEEEAKDHAECEYVAFMVNLYEDETATIKTYNGSTVEKTWTDMNWHSDTAFVLDLSDHNEGDWSMTIDITRMDGSTVSYKITLGTITAGV